MLNSNKSNISGVLGVFILYAFIAVSIFITLAYQQPGFKEILTLIIFFIVFILSLEFLEQALVTTIKWKIPLQVFLVLKEITICFFFSLFLLLLAATMILFFFGDIPMTKNLFNLLITSNFISTLFVYWIYNVINFPKLLDKMYLFITKSTDNSTSLTKEKLETKNYINIVDLFTIITTVFLLSNSTATSFSSEVSLTSTEFFSSMEFAFLFIIIAIYVLAAYYRIPSYKDVQNK